MEMVRQVQTMLLTAVDFPCNRGHLKKRGKGGCMEFQVIHGEKNGKRDDQEEPFWAGGMT
jgi:hypothetical protein